MQWFKKHKVITVILVLIVLGVIGSAAGGNKQNSNSKSSSSTASSSSSSKATTAKVGQPADDGKFEFTVSSIQCGQTTVGTNQYLQKQAQGQYCLLNLSIKNIGDQAQSLSSSDQYLYDAQNHKYSADDTATIYNEPSGNSSTWYNSINPGNSVTGTIVFDIPKGVTPTTAELHDSAFSGGVKVTLQ